MSHLWSLTLPLPKSPILAMIIDVSHVNFHREMTSKSRGSPALNKMTPDINMLFDGSEIQLANEK